jgi:putative membrane protein
MANKKTTNTKQSKKEVIIEEKNSTNQPKKSLKHKIYEILLYLFSYTVTFLIVEQFFKTFVIAEPKILYAIIATIIIYILNQVVRPLLVTFTMPIMGITFGLFYIVINCIILKITDLIMFSKLEFKDVFILFFISILLSILRFLIEDVILKPIIKRALKNE